MQLGFQEYFKNFWFNLVSVLVLGVLAVSSVILISTVDKETRLYRFVQPYLGEQGDITTVMTEQTLASLEQVEGVLMSSVGYFTYGKKEGFDICVYDSDMEQYLEPIMKEGTWISKAKKQDEYIRVVVSGNRHGFKTGDVVPMTAIMKGGEDSRGFEVLVCGVIEDGQSVYNMTHHAYERMDYTALFQKFSAAQLEIPLMITTEEELKKIEGDVYLDHGNVLIRYKDDISSEVKLANREKISLMYQDIYVTEYLPDTVLTSLPFLKNYSELKVRNICLKYIPLIGVNFILITICLVGIVAIKTMVNMRDYGKLYLCGMKWNFGIWLSAGDMMLNCLFAGILSIVLIKLQNTFDLFGKIFVEFRTTQGVIMLAMFGIIILCSSVVTGVILRKNTAMDMIRESNV